MGNIDHATLLWASGILQMAMPLMVWVLLYRQRSFGVRLWCASSGLLGVSVLLLLFREVGPDLLGYVLPLVLALGGLLLRWMALRWELDRALHGRRALMIWCGLGLALWGLFTLRPQIYTLWMPIVLALAFACVAFTARVLWKQRGGRSAGVLAWTFTAQTLVYGLIAVRWWQQGGAYPFDPGSVLLAERIAVVMMFIAAAVVNTCYAGMMLDHSARLEAELAQQAQRQRRVAELSERLAHLDRQVTMGLLSRYLAHQLEAPIEHMQRHIRSARAMLEQSTKTTELVRNFLENVVYQTREMAATVDGMKTFLQFKPMQIVPMAMPTAWRDALLLTRGLLARSRVDIDPEQPFRGSVPPPVMGHLTSVTQLLVGVLRLLLQDRRAEGAWVAGSATLQVESITESDTVIWRVWMMEEPDTTPFRRRRPDAALSTELEMQDEVGVTLETFAPLLKALNARLVPCDTSDKVGPKGYSLTLPLAAPAAATAVGVSHA